MPYIDSTTMSIEDLKSMFSNTFKLSWYKNTPGEFYSFNDPVIPSFPVISDTSEESDDFVATVYWGHDIVYNSRDWDTARGSIASIRYGAKLTLPNNNTHVCLVRYKSAINKWSNTYTTDGWIILSNTYGADGIAIEGKSPSLLTYHSLTHNYNIVNDYRNSEYNNTVPDPDGRLTFGVNQSIRPHSRADFVAAGSINGMSGDDAASLVAIYDGCGETWLGMDTAVDSVIETHPIIDILPSQSINWFYGRQIVQIDAIPRWMPVFDISQVDDIVKFLKTGDDSGAIDPFDKTPKIEPITDYKTNFDMYISANDKSNNKYTIVAVNNQYNQNREELQGLYELKASPSIPFDVNSAFNPSQAQVPTITFNKNVNNRDEVSFYFGDTGYTENYSGCFQVSLIKDPTSTVNVKINTVYWSDYPGDEGSIIRGYAITDGYEYIASSGERLRIFFKSISLDDVKDIVDDNYPSKDDDDNNRTGSDVIPLYGSGLRTYILSEGAFDQVNKALWNTDWSTVFKTTTIDPIKCVISCKRIPFTVSGTSSDTIYLANRDIAASTAFISPVKKFRIGSYTIPAIYGNFVDITMTKIHVYLPYIGWKELPAPEVMSRVGRAQVGLQSKTYNLTFDYIVDFVDGNVRCIVAVNGTERWYFDGNCAIDVPVTSDNHTAAVSTAIKSGVATVMSVGSTIGGMWSGNALAVGAGMMGTIQNAMNVVPTYEYSATGSPSGYIDATMNKHIMLVIEYPNAFYPSGYSHKVGLPCMLNLSLGSCSGFTRTVNVDTRGINCTADESDMIKNLLNAGVYL